MALRKKIKWAFIFSVVFLLVYLFLAATPLSGDFCFQPEWTRPIALAAPIAEGSQLPQGLNAFMLADEFGFFSPTGEIFKGDARNARFSAGGGSWCVYGDGAESASVYGADGSLIMTIEEAGFVHITENGTYLFRPGGGAVTRYANNGSLIWTRDEAAPITAFSDSAAGTIIGYANGLLVAVDGEGEEIFSLYPGGSEHQVVLAAALSSDGSRAVCVSGINPQRAVLVEGAKEGQHRITAHKTLEGALRRQAFAAFGASGSRAFFETSTGLGVIDTETRRFSEVQLEGQALAAVECEGTPFFAVLSKAGPESHTFALVEDAERKAAEVAFKCRDAFLLFAGGGLCLGTDGSISKINISALEDITR